MSEKILFSEPIVIAVRAIQCDLCRNGIHFTPQLRLTVSDGERPYIGDETPINLLCRSSLIVKEAHAARYGGNLECFDIDKLDIFKDLVRESQIRGWKTVTAGQRKLDICPDCIHYVRLLDAPQRPA